MDGKGKVRSRSHALVFDVIRNKSGRRRIIARLLSMLVTAALVMAMMPMRVMAVDISSSKFGETIDWNETDNRVTVTGYGEMWDFDSNNKHTESTTDYYTPGGINNSFYWNPFEHRYSDYTVGFSSQTEKITYIGKYSFSGYHSSRSEQGRALTGSLDIPESVTKIGDYAFYYDKITSLKLNKKLREIGEYAFAWNHSLPSIVMNSDLQEIGSFAFAECHTLSSLVLNKGLEKIDADAFYNCDAIKGDLTIPATVKEIGERAFKGCSSYDGQLLFEEGSDLEEIPEDCFRNTGFDGILSLPDGLERIGANAFTNCCIERVYIPKSVTYIADTAFDKCNFIKKIYYGGTSTEWANIKGTDVNGFTGVPVAFSSKIKMCRVTFDSNGADPIGAQVVVEGDPLTVPVISREGYTLEGWYDDSGKKWNFDTDTVVDHMTLTAKWTADIKEFTVEFDSNGGSEVDSQTVAEGSKLIKPVTEREGYTLNGWYDEDSYKWDFDNDTVTKDMVLKAEWAEEEEEPATEETDPANPENPGNEQDNNVKKYTVTFEPQNGDEAVKVSVSMGKCAVLPADPTRKDYIFKGWYTKENGYGNRFSSYTTVNANITVYASWSDNRGKVGYKKLVAKQKYDVSDFLSLPNTASKKKYVTSSKSVASVSSKGQVKAKKAGSSVITGQYMTGSAKDWTIINNSIEIDVEKPVVTKKYTASSLGSVSGNDLYQGTSIPPTSWESSKPNVAAVDRDTGEINILSSGTSKISIIWGEGKDAAKYKVTIKVPKGLS